MEALVPAEFAARGGRIVRSSVDAIFPGEDRCNVGGPDDVVVVTGSIYLLGEIMARLAPQRGPGEGRLQDF
jgi:dihydrofolate synthase/folylpolyglutamate synthase